jgi:hypothetical protein
MSETPKPYKVDCPHCDYHMEFSQDQIDDYGEVGCEYCHAELYVGNLYPNVNTNESESQP